MKEWLKNSWYIVARASEVTPETQPVRKKVLGQNLALFVNQEGKVAAVNDICPHMGASLGLGFVKDGCIVCPYHHFAFGSTGKCAGVPSVVAPRKVPNTLMVDSYPVAEKYGYIWVFLGDLPESERPPIVEVEQFSDPEFRKLPFQVVWKGSMRPALENLLDFTHFSYLHANTFGNGDYPYRDEYEVAHAEHEVSCTIKVKLNAKNWFFPPVPELGKDPDVTVRCRYHVPTVVVNDFSIADYRDVTMFAFTPVDDNEYVIYGLGCRNFQKDDAADENLKGLGERILEEDRIVIESCLPEVLPHAVGVPVDRYLLAARNLYDRLLKSGNSVEPHTFQTQRGLVVTVVPSPVRAGNETFGRSWARREEAESRVRDSTPLQGRESARTNQRRRGKRGKQ